MNSFKIYTHEGKEEHFKTAIKAFDPEARIVKQVENCFEIETKLFNTDIRVFTSVKTIQQLGGPLIDWEKVNMENINLTYKDKPRDFFTGTFISGLPEF